MRRTKFGWVDDNWESPWEIETKARLDGYGLKQVVARFFELVDKVEVSDNDVEFKPNRLEVHSCRALDGVEIGWLIERMKKDVKG